MPETNISTCQRCWDVASFCPLVVFVAGVRSRCPCSGVWLLSTMRSLHFVISLYYAKNQHRDIHKTIVRTKIIIKTKIIQTNLAKAQLVSIYRKQFYMRHVNACGRGLNNIHLLFQYSNISILSIIGY